MAKQKNKDNLVVWLKRDMKAVGIPDPEEEYRFHPTRRWRFDFAWPANRVAVEVEGGIFQERSGHRSITGMLEDMEKYNEAALLGWRLLRVSNPHLKTGEAVAWVERAMK